DGLKVLIFSYFRQTLAAASEVAGGCPQIIGGLSAAERERGLAMLRNAEGFAVLALQFEVGGQGLNLPEASVVVLMEPQYKPTTEWQAVGRVYRMGQTRPVVVHRLVAEQTVEARIVERTGFKARDFDQLVRRSSLADAIAENYVEADTHSLLAEERQRLGMPPTAA